MEPCSLKQGQRETLGNYLMSFSLPNAGQGKERPPFRSSRVVAPVQLSDAWRGGTGFSLGVGTSDGRGGQRMGASSVWRMAGGGKGYIGAHRAPLNAVMLHWRVLMRGGEDSKIIQNKNKFFFHTSAKKTSFFPLSLWLFFFSFLVFLLVFFFVVFVLFFLTNKPVILRGEVRFFLARGALRSDEGIFKAQNNRS